MVFASIEFLIFFLPLTLAAYFLAPGSWRNGLLLAASLLFYLWGSGALVAILLAAIVLNYAAGMFVASGRDAGDPVRIRLGVAAAVAVNLAILGHFKYANFLVDQLNAVGARIGAGEIAWDGIVLPIGISFYTFQAMSYVFDIARGTARPARSLLDFALYVSMFPQLIAGPIVRYSSVARELVERRVDLDDLTEGCLRFALGLVKKVVIADSVAPIADAAFSSGGDLTFSAAWLGLFAYTIQIYFDFSGYSDMAIGLGRILGFRFPENFDRPYSAHSITEFWRRWHMSLSSWFRDYLYIPLGGNRAGAVRTYVNLWIVFIVTGLWHGAAWTFVLWGAWHGLLLVVERATGWRERRFSTLLPVVGARVLTLSLVMAGWVLFRSPDIASAANYFAVLATPDMAGLPPEFAHQAGNRRLAVLALSCLVLLLPRDWNGPRLLLGSAPASRAFRSLIVFVGYPYALMLVIVGAFTSFIYFQF